VVDACNKVRRDPLGTVNELQSHLKNYRGKSVETEAGSMLTNEGTSAVKECIDNLKTRVPV
jgi:hypothetical protein